MLKPGNRAAPGEVKEAKSMYFGSSINRLPDELGIKERQTKALKTISRFLV